MWKLFVGVIVCLYIWKIFPYAVWTRVDRMVYTQCSPGKMCYLKDAFYPYDAPAQSSVILQCYMRDEVAPKTKSNMTALADELNIPYRIIHEDRNLMLLPKDKTEMSLCKNRNLVPANKLNEVKKIAKQMSVSIQDVVGMC